MAATPHSIMWKGEALPFFIIYLWSFIFEFLAQIAQQIPILNIGLKKKYVKIPIESACKYVTTSLQW